MAINIIAGLAATIPKAAPQMKPVTTVREDPNKKEKLHYIAIGDSLTEGVGDQTKEGGFVPLVANVLKVRYNLTAVETE
ncbi:lipase, partial [Enterococcus faecium]